ncbi:MAG: TetR/AcrR family transcriptional regulator [Desulfobacterales bacterium]|nr:TetR/AcrR family transcriptional regulator [Desulfobacterales bacterium]
MSENNPRSQPPGRRKIVRSVRKLLETNDFNSITTAEIARTAGVTEGLIYKYFDNKRDLLYHVLETHFNRFITQCEAAIADADTALLKLRAIMHAYLDSYNRHRVFARILLLEVRNAASFFESSAYAEVRRHSRIILGIIKTGIENGEIRDDVAPEAIRDAMFGTIEHSTLASLIFNRPLDADAICERTCRILFDGIRR